MTTTTATAIINVLRAVFARYGLPHEVVSDNGPQFVPEEYQTVLKMNRIKLTLVPSYHPASNGLAGRHARTSKGCIKLMANQGLCNPEWLIFYSDTGILHTPLQVRLQQRCF